MSGKAAVCPDAADHRPVDGLGRPFEKHENIWQELALASHFGEDGQVAVIKDTLAQFGQFLRARAIFFLFDIFAEARPKPGVGALAGYAHDLPVQRQDIDREFCPGQICRSESVNCQEIESAFEHGSVWRRPAKVKLGIYGWILLSWINASCRTGGRRNNRLQGRVRNCYVLRPRKRWRQPCRRSSRRRDLR